jgi:multidrug efflux pump
MQEQDKRIQIMQDAPPLKAIFTMSIPVILGMMVNVIYNLVDTWFIGMMGDELQLAASSYCTPIFVIVMAVASLIGTGGASYLSRSLGAGRKDKAEKTLATVLLLVCLFGLLVAIAGIVFRNQIPHILGASELSFKFTQQYGTILMVGGVFIIGNFALGQLIRAEGSTKLSMVGMMVGTVANIVLDPLFIFTFGWGISGAAVATVIGNGSSMLFYLICYLRRKTLLSLALREFTLEPGILKEIFAIGVPATIGQMLISVAQVTCNNLASAYGDVTVASLGIALKIMTIGTYVFMGFSAGCQPLMGYNYGAGNYERMTKFIKTGILSTSLVGLFLTLVLGASSPFLVAVFTPLGEVRSSGSAILRTLILSLPFMGGITLCSTTFQAMGRPLKALILTISRQGLLYIPLLFLLNHLFGLSGMVYSQPITDLIMLLVSSAFILKVLHSLKTDLRGADNLKDICGGIDDEKTY